MNGEDGSGPAGTRRLRIGTWNMDHWRTTDLSDAAALPATFTIRVIVDGAVVATQECSPARPCGDLVFWRA